jgi:hypothetical protein
MTPADTDELIPTERVAIIVYLLCKGHSYTTMEAGMITGLRRKGAWAMLSKVSRVLPLAGPDRTPGSNWHLLPDEDDMSTDSGQ